MSSTTAPVSAAAQRKAAMNLFERYLTLWVALCIVAGVALGSILPGPFHLLSDMTVAQVEAILGEGTSQGGDGSNVAAQFGVDVTGGAAPSGTVDYVWENGKKSITVTFRKGRVTAKRSSGL